MLDFCTIICILFSLSSFLDNIMFFPMANICWDVYNPTGAFAKRTPATCARDARRAGPKRLTYLLEASDLATVQLKSDEMLPILVIAKLANQDLPKRMSSLSLEESVSFQITGLHKKEFCCHEWKQLSDMSVKRHVAKSRKISMDSPRCFDFALQG